MPGVFMIPASTHRGMIEDALAHPDRETGGTILGVRRGVEFIGVINIPAGPAARRTLVRYSPDTEWQQAVVDVVTQRLRHLTYVSDWHMHPGGFDRPSVHDLRTAREIVTDEGWDSPAAVFPIGVREAGKVRFRAYLMQRETLEFREIPLLILDDHDPRLTAALTGMDAPTHEALHETSEANDAGRDARGDSPGGILNRIAASLRNSPRH